MREVFLSSLPLAIIIVICVAVWPLSDTSEYIKIAVGYVCVVVGQSLFLVGLDESILPAGKLAGSSMSKIGNVAAIIVIGFLFGFFATVAEPALSVLANQAGLLTETINPQLFIWVLSGGTGVFVSIALYRIIKNISIKKLLAVLYLIVFAAVFFVPDEFIGLAFDGSGATTGDVSVPFMLALGIGIVSVMSKRKTSDDIFGIIGIASVGSILAQFIYGVVINIMYGGRIPPAAPYNPGAIESAGEIIKTNIAGVFFAILPILILFIPMQIFIIKLPAKKSLKMLLGIVPVCVGLFIFLAGIDYGFAFAAKYIGEVFCGDTSTQWFRWLLLPLGFILGAAITLTEPAVIVLGNQLEEITNGHIKKNTIRITLAVGIGFASLLAMLKILTQINILWFFIPLYTLALGLMPFTSDLFVGLAFDSGGVSGGAMTSAFLTPLTLGAAQAVALSAGPNAQSVLTNGFGIIGFVSATPMIAVQVLGIIYERRMAKFRIHSAELEQAEFEELSAYAGDNGDELLLKQENTELLTDNGVDKLIPESGGG